MIKGKKEVSKQTLPLFLLVITEQTQSVQIKQTLKSIHSKSAFER